MILCRVCCEALPGRAVFRVSTVESEPDNCHYMQQEQLFWCQLDLMNLPITDRQEINFFL